MDSVACVIITAGSYNTVQQAVLIERRKRGLASDAIEVLFRDTVTVRLEDRSRAESTYNELEVPFAYVDSQIRWLRLNFGQPIIHILPKSCTRIMAI